MIQESLFPEQYPPYAHHFEFGGRRCGRRAAQAHQAAEARARGESVYSDDFDNPNLLAGGDGIVRR